MSHPTCHRTSSPRALGRVDLDHLVDHLVGAHVRPLGEPPAPALVRARPTPDGIDLALAPLPVGTHPAEVLVGHRVPGRWWAAGLVAPATAHPLTPADGPSRPMTIALLLGRDGHLAHRGTGAGSDALPHDEAPEGRLVDLLHRALGMATPPPAEPPRQLWEALWLDGVVAQVARGEPGALAPEMADALAATSSPEGTGGWGHLRQLAARPAAAETPTDVALAGALAPLIDPEGAAWMDDGCFARWVLGGLPSTDELLDAIDVLLPPARARAVRSALGLVVDAPPGPGDR